MNGRRVAIKFYFPHMATGEVEKNLLKLIGMPAPDDHFAWPEVLVRAKKAPGFGYVMKLRPPGMMSIQDVVNRKAKVSFRVICRTLRLLAHTFCKLHAEGLCYMDMSYGNIFFDATGDVFICDNDNVTVDGNENPIILGTMNFMAPEVVTGKALPSVYTDLFSLAIIMFRLLIINHPLLGAAEARIHCMDEHAQELLLGKNPVFIFDPVNDSNRPVPGEHDNALLFWPVFPRFVKRLFVRSFTDGIKDPKNGRVRENEWRSAMVQLEDSIFYCQCGAENFYDGERLAGPKGKLHACWACKREVGLPARMRLKHSIIMLNHDTKLYPHHLDEGKIYDFSAPLAEMTKHPSTPGLWGLKNLSGNAWKATQANGAVQDVPAGRAVSLDGVVSINFGSMTGEIKA